MKTTIGKIKTESSKSKIEKNEDRESKA